MKRTAALGASNLRVHKLAVKLHMVCFVHASVQCAHIQYVGWHYHTKRHVCAIYYCVAQLLAYLKQNPLLAN